MSKIYDCITIGCGATGLSALINGSSEGLSMLGIDINEKAGGLIGTTSCIENYPGFPNGIQGCELVDNMYQQALKFGAEFLFNSQVVDIGKITYQEVVEESYVDRSSYFSLSIKEVKEVNSPYKADYQILTKSIIVCTGRWHKKLGISNEEDLVLNKKLLYGHPPVTDVNIKGHIIIIGGGNSAGQAATWLVNHACQVTIICPSFKAMSQYLIDRLLAANTGVKVVMGRVLHIQETSADLCVISQETPTSNYSHIHCDKVYSLIGLDVTDTFPELLDKSGFMIDGKVEGIVVAGDCRLNSEKRCTAAVGEGVQAVTKIHTYLATLTE